MDEISLIKDYNPIAQARGPLLDLDPWVAEGAAPIGHTIDILANKASATLATLSVTKASSLQLSLVPFGSPSLLVQVML